MASEQQQHQQQQHDAPAGHGQRGPYHHACEQEYIQAVKCYYLCKGDMAKAEGEFKAAMDTAGIIPLAPNLGSFIMSAVHRFELTGYAPTIMRTRFDALLSHLGSKPRLTLLEEAHECADAINSGHYKRLQNCIQ